MDYKEKYNKLVEAVKVLQKTNPSDEGIQNWVNENVPELKESEGEKVRKEILEYFQQFENEELRGVNISDWVAWLEKQGMSYTKRDVDDAYVEGMAFAKDELEKQKPAWSEDDERHLNNTIAYLKDAKEFKKTAENCIDWLKSLKQRIGGYFMIQNGIILDGVVYELTTGFPDNNLSLCGNCELNEKCIEFDGSLCYFFADNFRKVFRKVKMERKL